jgi:hypothetical protein
MSYLPVCKLEVFTAKAVTTVFRLSRLTERFLSPGTTRTSLPIPLWSTFIVYDREENPTAMPPTLRVGSGALRASPRASNAEKEQLVRHIRTSLERIADQQEEVADTREQVLIDREKASSSTKRVREQRQHTGSAEAWLMDNFRKHYNDLESRLPESLVGAYLAVEEARNNLTSMEDGHFRIMQKLGVSEWALTDVENDLYQYSLQQILPDENSMVSEESGGTRNQQIIPAATSFAPSPDIQYQVVVKRHNHLVRRFRVLRKDLVDFITIAPRGSDGRGEQVVDGPASAGFLQTFGDLLSQIIELEVDIQRLKPDLSPEDSVNPGILRSSSDSGRDASRYPNRDDLPMRARSDGAFSRLSEEFPSKSLVHDWLLDCLNKGALEKVQYLTILMDILNLPILPDAIFEDWEERATRVWSYDMNDLTINHVIQPPQSKHLTGKFNEYPELLDLMDEQSSHSVDALDSLQEFSQYLDASVKEAAILVSSNPEKGRNSVSSHVASSPSNNTRSQVEQEDEAISSSRKDASTSEYQSLPVYRVITPEDHYESVPALDLTTEQLSPTSHEPSRCDSAQWPSQNEDHGDIGSGKHATPSSRRYVHCIS